MLDDAPDDLLRLRPKADVETRPLGRVTTFSYQGTTPKLDMVSTNDLERPVTYDAAGNELSYAVSRDYTARNLLGAVSEDLEGTLHRIAYGYDGRGVRVTRSEPSAANVDSRRYFFYTPELQLLAVTSDDEPNAWARRVAAQSVAPPVAYEIVWLAGKPMAQLSPTTPPRYTFTDHLGTPLLQTGPTATITWRAEHEPFGNVHELREGTRPDQPLRLPGQELAMTWEGTEENYNVFRWYRSGWGRYSQSDPIGLKSDTHLYRYTYSNPIVATDPLGLAVWFCNRKTAIGIFNHSYLWDDRPTTRSDQASGGQGDNSGHEIGPQRPGLPPGWGDQCTRVPGSDNREDPIMRCCQAERTQGFWRPFGNDCHAVAGRCLERVLGHDPGAPGGRAGDPCNPCNRPPQTPRDRPLPPSPIW